MILIIDAYNVLKHKPHQTISEQQRDQYIARIDTYCQRKKHYAWLVFDGGPYLYPVTESYNMVSVMYSGEDSSADSCIMRLLLQQPVDNTILVSSDNELVRYAENSGIVSIEPSVFSYYVNKAFKPDTSGYHTTSGAAQKRPGHESSSYVDRLMHMASEHMLFKDDDIACDIEGEPEVKSDEEQSKSKREKLLNRIVRKL